MYRFSGIIVVILLLMLGMASCSQDGAKEHVYIEDNAGLLDSTIEDSLCYAYPNNMPLAIVTVDSVALYDLSGVADSVFAARSAADEGFSAYGVLVLASARPNVAMIKMGSYYDEVEYLALPYASRQYYRLQIDDATPPVQKVLGMVDMGMASANNTAFLYSQIKGEVLGELSVIVSPSDGFFYQYILRPIQYPFILVLNITGNFYLSAALYVLLFVVIMLVVRRVMVQRYRRCNNEMKRDLIKGVLPGILVLVYDVPLLLGGLSFASCFSLSGVEFIDALVTDAGLSASVVNDLFQSGLSDKSYLLSVVTTVWASMIIYLNGGDSKYYGFKVAIVAVLAFWSGVAINVYLLIFYLPLIAFCGKITNIPTYIDLRVNGMGKVESMAWTLLKPAVIVVAAIAGLGAGEYVTAGSQPAAGSVATVGQGVLDTAITGELMEIYGQPQAAVQVSQAIKIVEPLHLTDSTSEFHTYKFTIDSRADEDSVFVFFDATYDGYKTCESDFYPHVKKGEQELKTTVFHKYKLKGIKAFGVRDDSLADRFETEDSCSFRNTGDETLGYVMKFHHPKSQPMILVGTLSRGGSVNYNEKISIDEILFYRLP